MVNEFGMEEANDTKTVVMILPSPVAFRVSQFCAACPIPAY